MENISTSTPSQTGRSISRDKYAAIITNFTISVITLAANAFVISLYFWKSTILLKKASSRLLFSLSISDFLTAIGVVLTTVCNFVPQLENPRTSVGFTYRIILDIYETLLVKTLVMHLCGLTLDRYLALFFALRYQAIITNRTIRRYIVASWVVPFLASAVQLLWLHKVISGNTTEADWKHIDKMDIWFGLISFITFLALPMILLAVAFTRMIFEIQRIVRHTPGRLDAGPPSRVSSNERRAIYIFSLMYVTFLLLAMPYFSLRLSLALHPGQKISRNVYRWTVALKYLTSFVRPVLYALTSPEIRTVARQLRKKFLNDTPTRNYAISFSQGHLRSSTVFYRSETISTFASPDLRQAMTHLREMGQDNVLKRKSALSSSREDLSTTTEFDRNESVKTDLLSVD